MFIIKERTKDYIIYNYLDNEIAHGKTQLGNDLILRKYMEYKDSCKWYHLANSTSAHVIVYSCLGNFIEDSVIREKFFSVESCKLKKKDHVLMKCWLKDITMTDTLGLVYTANETYIK